jgi:hypothetical protein
LSSSSSSLITPLLFIVCELILILLLLPIKFSSSSFKDFINNGLEIGFLFSLKIVGEYFDFSIKLLEENAVVGNLLERNGDSCLVANIDGVYIGDFKNSL